MDLCRSTSTNYVLFYSFRLNHKCIVLESKNRNKCARRQTKHDVQTQNVKNCRIFIISDVRKIYKSQVRIAIDCSYVEDIEHCFETQMSLTN